MRAHASTTTLQFPQAIHQNQDASSRLFQPSRVFQPSHLFKPSHCLVPPDQPNLSGHYLSSQYLALKTDRYHPWAEPNLSFYTILGLVM